MSLLGNKGGNNFEDIIKTPASDFKKIRLADIQEDVNQPREYFDEESLNELAETIKQSGVKTPISVHIDTNDVTKYIINHGARRYRAAVKAGLEFIPAIIDNEYTSYDQIIENLHRDDLKPIEIARFVQKMINQGHQKKIIAKKLGKSPAFITQHVNLLNLPDCIQEAFESERTQDVTVLNDLTTLHRKNAEEVELWLQDPDQDINRHSLKYLKSYLDGIETVENIHQDKETGNDIADSADAFKKHNSADENLKTSKDQLSMKPATTTFFAHDNNEDVEVVKDITHSTDEFQKHNKSHKEDSSGKDFKVIVSSPKFVGNGTILLSEKPSAKGFCFVKLDSGEISDVDVRNLIILGLE